jgi:hypothetical protein
MRLLEHAEDSTSLRLSPIWIEFMNTNPSFHSEDSPVVQVDMLCAKTSTITMVDSQRSPSSTLRPSSSTLSQTLNKRVLMLKNAKSLTFAPKELSTEEEEPTEHMVESLLIFPPTAILSSTLLRNPDKLPEKTNKLLD